jgi:molybdate transport system substrate-binding protein
MVLLCGPLIGCGTDSDPTVVTVYAASSLTDIMTRVEEQYEEQHPTVDVRVNVAGSNTLVRQLNSGAEADLFIAADISAFDQLLDRPVAGPHVVATNTLTLIVPAANRAGITGPEQLADPDVLTARCATGVPCGNATDRYLEQTGFSIGRSTDEPNVRSVLAKVAADEVDAGFVYRSDLHAVGGVVEIPLDGAPQVTVGLAQLRPGDEVGELVATLRSEATAALFQEMGFTKPVDAPDQ